MMIYLVMLLTVGVGVAGTEVSSLERELNQL
ncbi:hypothetical protein BHO_0900070 (plasmid) [Borrelia hermsii YBT]|uniref:Uncharacterized protein n=1 Tax=Borrelia hermsii YBT TaxID=1313295 RepID=W5T386_BORHE|nr:hypothetical protein BHO_0900070 [Borrelia hermsii YBT]